MWLGGLAVVRCPGRARAGISKQVLQMMLLVVFQTHLALQPGC